jgi:hypothetical protein
VDIRIATMHPSTTLVVQHAERLAEAFFRYDPSSAHKQSYDVWIQGATSPVNRIVAADVTAINTTMAARSPLDKWTQFTASPTDLPELAAVDPVWDLFRMPEVHWQALHCRSRIQSLLHAVIGPWRNASVATKVLHSKRPGLIPVLDSYVVAVLGGPVEPGAVEATDVIVHLRKEGRTQLVELEAIQDYLAGIGYKRPRVRLMDALLWLSHPGAWSSAAYKYVGSATATIAVQ